MSELQNKDEPELDAWAPLAAANARILRNIFPRALSETAATASLPDPHEKKDERRDNERRSSDDEKQRAEQHSEYVDRRLKDLAAFERKASGKRS